MPEGNTGPAVPDPAATEQPTIGARIKHYRTRRGMSREVLGGLIGMSARWVKAVESGQIQQPKLPTLISIAEALKVRDLSQLVGGHPMPITLFRGPGHPALPAVRAAVNTVAVPLDASPPPLPHLQARLTKAWQTRHSSPDHRTVVGALLPDLIRDGKHAVRAYEGEQRRQALAALSEAYCLAQFFCAYQPDAGLLWRIAERAMMTAEEAENPQALGKAVWLLAEAHRDSGDFDAAESVIRDGLDLLRPHIADSNDDTLLGVWGALHFAAAFTAARAGQRGVAWRWWDDADRIAQSLPADHYDLMTSFSRAIMPAHAVTVAVELRQKQESIDQADRAEQTSIPSRPRRGRHLIEAARARQLGGRPDEALSTLQRAHDAAPETIRYNGYARRMIMEFADGPRSLRRPARELAEKVGVFV